MLASWGRACDELDSETATPASTQLLEDSRPRFQSTTENISFGHILTVSSFKATKPLQIPQTAESPGHVPTRPEAGTAQLQGHIEEEDRCEAGSCPPEHCGPP